jgi:hypothetical protein
MSLTKNLQGTGMVTAKMGAIDQVCNGIPFSTGIDFGYVCVGKSYSKTLPLYNPSNQSVKYSLQVADSHFTVTPL